MGQHEVGAAPTFALVIAQKEKPALKHRLFSSSVAELIFQIRKMFQARLLACLFRFLSGDRSRVTADNHVIANLLLGLLRHKVRLSHAR